MNLEKKYELVNIAYNNSFAKYSAFQVGAVVILKNGEYYLGTNVENASYGLTNCAERSALFSAYSNGVRRDDIKELVLIARGKDYVYPCGACRQVIAELMSPDADITIFKFDKTYKALKVKDLLPFCFSEEDLNAK